MKLYRSILFVPGNRPSWIDKAPQYGSDALILDLEDAVPIEEKVQARAIVREGIERLHKRGVPVVVRVNGLNPGQKESSGTISLCVSLQNFSFG